MAESDKSYRTRSGKVLTDSEIERIADEAEGGYDLDVLKGRKRGRPTLGSGPAEVVPVRIDPELREAVKARAQAEGTTMSEIIRKALRKFLEVA